LERPTEPPRLLLIALDAVPPELLFGWTEDGTLPNLRRLRDEATWGEVTSNAELFPAAVWPTFFTGSDVSHHGVYHLLMWDRRARRLRPPGPDRCDATPFWHAIGASGVPVIALDVPFSETGRQAPNVNEVIGWGMHEGVWSKSHPASLLRDLNWRHGRAAQVREGPGERPDAETAAELPGIVGDVGRRVAIIEDLATRLPWRLFIAAFSEPHRAGHWFWNDLATGEPQGGLKQVLRAFDAYFPRLRSLLRPEDHLAVFSLHGMGPAYDVDRVAEATALHLGLGPPQTSTRLPDPVLFLRRSLPPALVRAIARRLPQRAYNWTFHHLQNARRERRQAGAVVNPLDDVIYVHADPSPSDEPRQLLDRLEAALWAITDASGRRLIDRIAHPSDLYTGPRLSLLPDIIAKPALQPVGPEVVMADGVRLRPPRRSSRNGEHTGKGFYFSYGPATPAGPGPTVAGEHLAAFFCAPIGLESALARGRRAP
jgi:predicted AlkP superfamily phosphohydrolase/phosphomutase